MIFIVSRVKLHIVIMTINETHDTGGLDPNPS